ncbi:unnamed protein product [Mytilus coruscus]|uniref:Uncharacterized protein n=1 Tax=Mytilus coruscus TaxID=42192 RepID=A0A6J8ALJ7_MYTCO|nr:unnamed protein product [Mytilus coruscus]
MPHNVHVQFGDYHTGNETDIVRPQDITVEVNVERQPKEDSDSMPSTSAVNTTKDDKNEKTTITQITNVMINGHDRSKIFYLILGGTIDITVHEVTPEGNLKEIHQACGGVWGCNTINKEFNHLLSQIFGDDVMSTFQTDNRLEYFEIMNEIERKKISYTEERGKERIRISSLIDYYKQLKGVEIKNILKATKFKDKVKFDRDKVSFNKELLQSLFDKSVAFLSII